MPAPISRIPDTFHAFAEDGWTLRALNPDAAPAELRPTLERGIPARVPGEAIVDLRRAGMIPDPFDADNETALQWIGDIDWCFTHEFEWHDDGSDRHDLVAYGLDTIAQIRLNGRPAGHSENFFRTWRWDVRGLLREGRNEIEISFTSPVAYTDLRERRTGYYPHAGHAFNQIRKPGYAFGWDWGIDAANSGIWRPIGLDSWSGARIDEIRTATAVDPDGTGRVTVTVGVERALSAKLTTGPGARDNGPVPLAVTLAREGFSTSVTAVIEPTRTTASVELRVPGAELWWPRGYGEQPLYDLTVLLNGAVEAAVDAVQAAPPTSAVRRERIGLRTVDVETAADAVGRPFRFVVNGVPIHARGYNWIPGHAFISQVGERDYRRGMRDLTESNANMVRVWGGGIYESDLFYDLADELGVLVWQDFALACAAYPEDAEMRAEIEAEARERIVRLMPHPSLALWNGSNECRQAYAGWDGYRQDLRDDDAPAGALGYGERGWGDLYYERMLPGLLERLDPSRYYLPSSPMSLTDYAPVNLDTDGTTHIWDIWNAADYHDYARYTPRFADEFGYQAPPSWSTLTRVVHDEPLDPFGAQMLVHQKAPLGNEKLALGMRSHLTAGRFHDVHANGDGTYGWLTGTDHWADIEDWHWACQLQQAQAIRFGISHMRAVEPVNAGALVWQLNDSWPVISWAAVDSDGHRKPMWYAARDCFRSRFAVIRPICAHPKPILSWERVTPEPDSLELVAVNDTRVPWHGAWRVHLVSIHTGEELALREYSMTIAAGGVNRVVLDAELGAGLGSADAVLVADPVPVIPVAGDAGTTGVDPAQDFARVIHDPAEVIDQHLDAEPFTATARACDGGYAVRVTARRYVRDLFCMADKVDPLAGADRGMISLLPGERADLFVRSSVPGLEVALTASNVLRCANDLKRG